MTILERNSKPVADGYSHGGAVNALEYNPDRVDALVQALEAGFEQ